MFIEVFECSECGEIFKAETCRSVCGDVVNACADCVAGHEQDCPDCLAQIAAALDRDAVAPPEGRKDRGR